MELTQQELEAMRDVDVRSVDPAMLRDIREVHIDTSLPRRERMLDFLRQIGNPYCYKHGKYIVKVSFSDTDATLLAPGENRHSGPGENRQFWPDENRQSSFIICGTPLH